MTKSPILEPREKKIIKEKFREIIMKFVCNLTKEKLELVKLEIVNWEDPAVETKTLNLTLRKLMKIISSPIVSDKLKKI